MTKEENMKKLSLLERNARGGMWDKLVDDLDESRLRYPRPRLSHAVREYMAESIAARPVYGLHQLARLL